MIGFLSWLDLAGFEVPAAIAVTVAVVLAGLVVLTVCVALFHPDPKRRKDAREVLTTLVPGHREQ